MTAPSLAPSLLVDRSHGNVGADIPPVAGGARNVGTASPSGDRARDIPPGALFEPWCLPILSPDDLASLAPDRDTVSAAQLAYLAGYNLLAPTSHNTVPQRFRFLPRERTLEVWLDRAFVLPASDAAGRQAAVSIGCGIANTLLSARAYGWTADLDLPAVDVRQTLPATPGEPRYVRMARLALRPWASPPEGEDALRAMLARKVIRAEYDKRVQVPEALGLELRAMVSRHRGLELHLLTDGATILFLSKFQELAETTVFNRDAFATELGRWLLENDSPSPVGMRGREFGLADDAARRIHRGLLREAPLLPDEMAGFAKGSALGVRSSSAVAVITSEGDSVPERIQAGQAYEESALLLLRHGLTTSMQAGVTEVEVPSLAMRGRLRTTKRPIAVFRIGRPLREEDWHRPHSSRPRLDDLMVPEDAA